MTVAELIAELQKMPQNVPVAFNDEQIGRFIEDIDYVMHCPEDDEYGDLECVIIGVEQK